MSDDERIGIVDWHKGVGLHDGQRPERLEIVRAEIDSVIALRDLAALFSWAKNVGHAPESRLLARAKVEAILEGYDRQKRPAGITVETLRAHTAGLASVRWRSPTHYGSRLCVPTAPGMPGMVKREVPLSDD
jgi:hypothetical protein